MSRGFFFRFHFFFNAVALYYSQKLPTLLTMLIVDVKCGRFYVPKWESGR